MVVTKEIPSLLAYREGNQLVLWCRYCAKWHYHGTNSFGHKVAHCYVPSSPYAITGYNLVDSGKLTEELKKKYKDRKPFMCRKCSKCLPPLNRHCVTCAKNEAIRKRNCSIY